MSDPFRAFFRGGGEASSPYPRSQTLGLGDPGVSCRREDWGFGKGPAAAEWAEVAPEEAAGGLEAQSGGRTLRVGPRRALPS